MLKLESSMDLPTSRDKAKDDEHEFTYDVNSPNGPNHWGEIRPEWSMCNQGDMQSLIDLTHKRVQTTSKLGRLDRDYKPSNATLVNRGHDMMVKL
nr:alpha carbonic anhydrase 7-like [Tanacetum cinerariifolium]